MAKVYGFHSTHTLMRSASTPVTYANSHLKFEAMLSAAPVGTLVAKHIGLVHPAQSSMVYQIFLPNILDFLLPVFAVGFVELALVFVLACSGGLCGSPFGVFAAFAYHGFDPLSLGWSTHCLSAR
jgi:hypothetical protein